jgi:hypothetical protein
MEKEYFGVCQFPPLPPGLSQMNQVHDMTSYSVNIYFNIIRT